MDFLGLGDLLAKAAQLANDPGAFKHGRRALLRAAAIWLAIAVGAALLYRLFAP